jgi:hypothetical protein
MNVRNCVQRVNPWGRPRTAAFSVGLLCDDVPGIICRTRRFCCLPLPFGWLPLAVHQRILRTAIADAATTCDTRKSRTEFARFSDRSFIGLFRAHVVCVSLDLKIQIREGRNDAGNPGSLGPLRQRCPQLLTKIPQTNVH